MKFSLTKDNLSKAVSLSEGIISARTTMSILSNILIETVGNKVRIISTNLETAVKMIIDANIEEEGSITVFAKRFGDIIRELPNDDILLETEMNKKIKIRSQNDQVKAEFSILGISKSEFPKIPEITEENTFNIEQKCLKDMINKTIFAVSTEESKYVLNGVNFDIAENELKMVATDGRRLAIISSDIKCDFKRAGVIVPQKVLGELLKILGEEGICKIGLSENQIFFIVDDITLISRLLEGQFPGYQDVIPKRNNKEVKLFTRKFYNAVRRVSLMANERFKRLICQLLKNNMIIKASDIDIGEGYEEIEVKYDNDGMELAFNSDYLGDLLRVMEDEELIIEMDTPTSPVIFREPSSDKYICIIMPMKIL